MSPNHSPPVPVWEAGRRGDADHHDSRLRKSQVTRTVGCMTTSIDRVREVIAASGLSQAEFASAVGLDAPKLSKSLSGVRRFTSSDVAHIAEVGNVSVDWLLGGEEPALATAARRAAGSSSAVAMREGSRLSELRGVASELGFPQPNLSLPAPRSRSARKDGEALAEAALAYLDDVTDVLAPDLADLVETKFAVDVAIAELGRGFDGLAATSSEARLILAAPTPITARQRFTLAHELAHVLHRDDQEVHLDEDVFAFRKDPSEVRANAFAAAFLLPADLLRPRVRRGFDEEAFASLVVDFKVSPQTLAFRLEGLNLIDKRLSADLQRVSSPQAAELVGRSAELEAAATQSTTTRPPKKLAADLFAAYSAGVTTLRPYAAAIGQDPRVVRAALETQKEDR